MQALQQVYEIYRNGAGICTDTRKLKAGDIFFALKGPNFNGNRFANDALDAGAALAVIDEELTSRPGPTVMVPKVLGFLQELARHHRRQLDIPVIGVAGSNGKTTTKELIGAVLSSTYKTFATPGNFNNETGVPLALLMMAADTRAAVIEMGARHPGEIAQLCEIAEPNIGLVTNVGKDHLETFGTVEQTRKTNAELYQYLAANDGLVLVHVSHEDLVQEAAVADRILLFGTEGADFLGNIESSFPFLKLAVAGNEGDMTIQTQLVGNYNYENVMAAVSIGRVLEIPDKLIKRAIEAYAPSNNRSQLLQRDDNTFILDAYNANPSSMEEALKSFDALPGANKVVILGDMLELGETSYAEHLAVAQRLQNMQLQQVVLVGDEFAAVAGKLDCVHFANAAQAHQWFTQQQFSNTLFLLKGSRGIAMEKVIG